MKLIVGLGNPGEKYEKTRHNLGFMTLDHFLKDFSSVQNTTWSDDKKLKSEVALIDWQRRSAGHSTLRTESSGSDSKSSGQAKVELVERVILAKPKTYMNNSGMGVRLLIDYYKISPEDLWVVYDDLDLPVGSMKIRMGGAAAGHHGVESIMATLNTDKFWRFRMGIGLAHGNKVDQEGLEQEHNKRTLGKVEDYVLGTFGTKDRNKIRDVIKSCSTSLEVALEKGMESAMNRFNTK
jgi:PTH1 family peptidyl-tRNA hydrolase